jgi:DNA-directed RNA polymerase subunit RPC12/RpoP/F0F1-type ATP synthase assembly protein I
MPDASAGDMAMDSPKIVSVNCNHCGAALEVDEKTRFVTCKYCNSRLAVQRTDSAVFTEVLEKIEEQTGQIAGNLKVIELQNELNQLDREWAMSRDSLMMSGRNGSRSEPSAAGGVVAIVVGVLFGGFWMVGAMKDGAPWFMSLFGIFFIGGCVVTGIMSIAKAGQLDTTRSDYESRRRQLMDAIEAEKHRQ